MRKAMRCPRFLKMRISVFPGGTVPLWLSRIPVSALPPHLRDATADHLKVNEDIEMWFPIFREDMGSRLKKKCIVCKKFPPISPLGFCQNCFLTLSYEMISLKILQIVPCADPRQIRSLPGALSRLGLLRIPVKLDEYFGVIPGREREFLVLLNDLAGLEGGERMDESTLYRP